MALITVGSIGDFSVVPLPQAKKALPNLKRVDSFSVLAEVTKEVPATAFSFATSRERRGLALKSLQLRKEFQNFLSRLFGRTSKIYFLAWAWDMTGLSHYPGKDADPDSCLIKLKGGDLREFIAAGAVLFPPRLITAGLALRIQIWESSGGLRHFGSKMEKVTEAIQQSDLNTALLGLAAGAGVATAGASAAIAAVEPAALELAKRVGAILKDAKDDAVDYFEGYYPAADAWSKGSETHQGNGSRIVLNRLV
jgi:hypothetical protein